MSDEAGCERARGDVDAGIISLGQPEPTDPLTEHTHHMKELLKIDPSGRHRKIDQPTSPPALPVFPAREVEADISVEPIVMNIVNAPFQCLLFPTLQKR